MSEQETHDWEGDDQEDEEPWWVMPLIILSIPLWPLVPFLLLLAPVLELSLAPFGLIGEAKHRSDLKKAANQRIAQEGVRGGDTTIAKVDVHQHADTTPTPSPNVDKDDGVILEQCDAHERGFKTIDPATGNILRRCDYCRGRPEDSR